MWTNFLILICITVTTSSNLYEDSPETDTNLSSIAENENVTSDLDDLDIESRIKKHFEKLIQDEIETSINNLVLKIDKYFPNSETKTRSESIVNEVVEQIIKEDKLCENKIDFLERKIDDYITKAETFSNSGIQEINNLLQEHSTKIEILSNEFQLVGKEINTKLMNLKAVTHNSLKSMENKIESKVQTITNSIDELKQNTSSIQTEISNCQYAQRNTAETVVQEWNEKSNITDIYGIVTSLKDGQTNLKQDLNNNQMKYELDLELLDKNISSEFDGLVANISDISDTIVELQRKNNSLTQATVLETPRTLVSETYSREPQDCSDIFLSGKTSSGIYEIYLRNTDGVNKVKAYCDMTTSGGGWTVIQRRDPKFKPRISFDRNWNEYEFGFGNLAEEFWFGLQNMSILTSRREYTIRFDLTGVDNVHGYAEYSSFAVSSAEEKYKLTVLKYAGNAGNAFRYHSGRKFTTKDDDNDLLYYENCADLSNGGWWYNDCSGCNLNGPPSEGQHTNSDGITWNLFKGFAYSLKFTEMKIRPTSFSTIRTSLFEN